MSDEPSPYKDYKDDLGDITASASGYSRETPTSPAEYVEAVSFSSVSGDRGSFVLRDASACQGKFLFHFIYKFMLNVHKYR